MADKTRESTLPYEPPAADADLTVPGMHVLLVYGAKIKLSREGRPGIRVTAGYSDGSVLLEAVGFDTEGPATVAIREAADACRDAGLSVQPVPHRMSNFPARRVRKAPPR